jgi:hypothetical protein
VFALQSKGASFVIDKPKDDASPADWWFRDGEHIYLFCPGTFVRLAGRKHAMEMIEKFCRVESLCPKLRPDG